MAEEATKKKRKRGRPKFEPSQEMRDAVKSMAGLRMPLADIATYTGVKESTLAKHFRQELRMGPIEVNAQIAQSLFDKAISNGPGSVNAAQLLAGLWLGWKPDSGAIVPTANANDQTSSDGTPKKTETILVEFVDPPKWPDDPPLEGEPEKKRIGA